VIARVRETSVRRDDQSAHVSTQLVDIAAAAQKLGVSVRYMRRLVGERRIPYVKLGHYVRFDANELERWIDRSRVDALPQPRS
jgi:excisionase family DNA binding protein